MLFKVDFEKAYDTIGWESMGMNIMGFCQTWIQWIKCCLESSSMSILVNGSPMNEFRGERGLHQGDPLAPFIFIKVVERVGGLTREAMKQDLSEGVNLGRGEFSIFIQQFSNNTLFPWETILKGCHYLESNLKKL